MRKIRYVGNHDFANWSQGLNVARLKKALRYLKECVEPPVGDYASMAAEFPSLCCLVRGRLYYRQFSSGFLPEEKNAWIYNHETFGDRRFRLIRR